MRGSRAAPWLQRADAFRKEAHAILATHEAARSRVFVLEDSYKTLTGLSLRQDDLLRQALRCAETSLFRAAHVMAWAGLMDFLEEKLESDSLVKLRKARPKWQGADISEMAESIPERQLVDVTVDVGLCTKNDAKALVGLLNKRNECAHPTAYYPQLNETVGYISEVLQRIKVLQPRSL
ncbi:MAG: hypothetical protein ACHQ9S_27175 [Candidatus Binatia bacterium]